MIPRIIHLTTKNGELNYFEQALLLKNKNRLSDWKFKVWSDLDNYEMVKDKFPEFLEVYRKIERGVVKSDIVRCMYMYCYGGMYMDTDYEIIQEIPDYLHNYSIILPASRYENENYFLGNCVFLSESGNMFWYDFIKTILENEKCLDLKENEIIDTTGPGALTKFMNQNNEKYHGIHIPEPVVFHPKVVNHGMRILVNKNTLGVHYCWGSWRSKKKYRIIVSKMIRVLQVFGLIMKN